VSRGDRRRAGLTVVSVGLPFTRARVLKIPPSSRNPAPRIPIARLAPIHASALWFYGYNEVSTMTLKKTVS
jgi:hypothetical protein